VALTACVQQQQLQLLVPAPPHCMHLLLYLSVPCQRYIMRGISSYHHRVARCQAVQYALQPKEGQQGAKHRGMLAPSVS
jgi:hypothetical protein